MAPSLPNVEPRNERGLVYTPLPQLETETDELDDDNLDDEDQPLSSISVESSPATTPTNNNPNSCYYSNEIFNVSAQTCEMAQDLLGFTVLVMLIFIPLYKHLGSPRENPFPPIFTINSMYISNFTIDTKGLGANWDAKFTVVNANVSSIYFRSIDFTLFYKQNPQDILSYASSYPFYLDQDEFVKLHLNFTTTGWEDKQLLVDNQLVEEIGKDRDKDGSLSFGMQMKVQAIYYGETWVSDVLMTPHCEDLKVLLLPGKDSGRLANPNRNFSVPIQWKPFSFF
ncbi:hypothetical protein RIF29_39649 [Crotalaria pallida]|uniref:Uncharacterized protein n=1 Tax=Crotalaria pallida TaxID=3830 RepID=A0AAN9E7X6_CROPI